MALLNLRNSTALICKTFALCWKHASSMQNPSFINTTEHVIWYTQGCAFSYQLFTSASGYEMINSQRGALLRVGYKQFSLFKKLLAAIICGFQTEDRSKSLEVTDTATSVQEKHGLAQVSACVIIIFINGCRNEVDLILSRAFIFAPLRNVSLFNSLFNLWAECCVTTQSTAVLQTNK